MTKSPSVVPSPLSGKLAKTRLLRKRAHTKSSLLSQNPPQSLKRPRRQLQPQILRPQPFRHRPLPPPHQLAASKPLHSLRKLLPKKASTSLRFMDQVQVAASSRPTSKTPNLAQPLQQSLKLLARILSNLQQRLKLWKSQSPICVKASARHWWPPRRKPRTSTCKLKSTAHHSQRFVNS